MDAGLLLQYVVIARAVVLSGAYVAKRQLPGPTRRLRIACALPLLRDGRAPWLLAVGRWIAPPQLDSAGACGTGCNGCGPSSPAAPH